MSLENLAKKLNLTNKEFKLLKFVKEADDHSLITGKDYTELTNQEYQIETTLLKKYITNALKGGGPIDYCRKQQIHGAFKQHYNKGFDLRIKIDNQK